MKLKPVTDKVAHDEWSATKQLVADGSSTGHAMRTVAKRFAGHGHCEMIIMQELLVLAGIVQVVEVAT